MVERQDLAEALVVGFGGLTLGSLAMLIPTEKKDKYLVPFIGLFATGFLFHLFYMDVLLDRKTIKNWKRGLVVSLVHKETFFFQNDNIHKKGK